MSAVTPPRLALTVLESREAVASHVARQLLADRLGPEPRPLGLATGTTMEPVYAALLEAERELLHGQRQHLRRHWRSYNLDEYVGLGSGDPGSFAAFMHSRLTGPLGLVPASVRLPDGQAADPQVEAGRYAAEIRAAGGIGLQLLGLGLNGHVGFNEPPCAATSCCRPVQLSAATRRHNAVAFAGDPAAVPEWAITLGLEEILAARRILLVVTGAAKADVLGRLLCQRPSPELPASWLQRHPAVRVIADRAALSGAAGGP
ncbi:MAG: glucosamine-6-phosphate deaminase [Prochlorococcaceae cyanobacterium]